MALQIFLSPFLRLCANGSYKHRAALYNNNNNQAFYSQASWGRLEMKPHKNRYKTRVKKKGKIKGDKKTKSKKEKR
jgi:hypothetical protein